MNSITTLTNSHIVVAAFSREDCRHMSEVEILKSEIAVSDASLWHRVEIHLPRRRNIDDGHDGDNGTDRL